MSKVSSDRLIEDEKSQESSSSGKAMCALVAIVLIAVVVSTAIIAAKSDDSESDTNTIIIPQHVVLTAEQKEQFKHSPVATQLKIQVIEDSDNELTLRISDALNPSFEVPESVPFPQTKNSREPKTGKRNYKYTLNKDNTLFKLERILSEDKKEVLFDMSGHELFVSALYNQFGTTLHSKYLYGIGERRKEFRYKGSGNYTTWNKDQFATIDFGQPSQQLYGTHPMWVIKEQSGNFHIGFLKSTSALLTEIDIDNNKQMIFHMVGGNIIIKFILGNNKPEQLIQAYHRYVNGYAIHPFWSSGYHQCRWGYKSSQELLEVVTKMDENDHPLDTVWNDLDYMTNYQDFTLHKDFKPTEMATLMDLTKPAGVYWVPLLDIGIATGTYAATEGEKLDVFLKSSVYKGKYLEGCVWPGPVYFPDFNHPNSPKYWMDMTIYMRDVLKVSPSGYWIDMNELASFIHGERAPEEECPGANPTSPLTVKESIDDRLYVPVTVANNNLLGAKTATLSTMHYTGDDALFIKSGNVTETFFHPINSLAEQVVTDQVLRDFTKKSLSFTLTRGSMFGSGRYTFHWTGDNFASWEFLKLALGELLSFQFYGIPLVGNDLCGFAGDTNAELCAKWLALGAWQPFARNHNNNESIAQEPYAFPEPYVLQASKSAFKNRYSLLKWMYTQSVNNYEHDLQAGVGTIIQPTWWLDPTDEEAFKYEDSLFIYANTFLIAPTLTQGNAAKEETDVTVYFPKSANWLSTVDYVTSYEGGKTQKFISKFADQALSFQKQGTIVMRQVSKNRARLLDNSFILHAYLDEQQVAYGNIMTLSDYDENNVSTHCLQKTDCIANIIVTLSKDKKTCSLEIKGKSATTKFDTFTIASINLYAGGLKYSKAINKAVEGESITEIVF